MMPQMGHRERVLKVLHHEEPDRVPLDLMGHASLLLDDAYFTLKAYLGIEGDTPPFREGHTANYYDERILERFDIDFRRVFLPETPAAKHQYHADGSFTDYWGTVWKKEGMFVNAEAWPLSGLSAEDLDHYPWPKPQELYHTEGLHERARYLYEETDYVVVARNPLTYGFLDRPFWLRGTEQFFVDLALNEPFVDRLIDRLLGIFMEVFDIFLDAAGPYVHIVEFGDDLGAQKQLLISPQTYRRFIKPAHRQLFSHIKSKAPQAKLFLHTDGAVYDVIEDLIEVGVDILNPVQPSAGGMESERLKRDFGDRLCFHGAVDQKPMEGPLASLIEEVKRRIDLLGPGGGYILAPCNHIIAAPPENVVAMYDTAREYDRYRRSKHETWSHSE